MAKLIVKDRRLCIVNGRLVSDADGAPCVCEGPVDGCDLNACVEIVFEGIDLITFFDYCNIDPDDFLDRLITFNGINPVLRVALQGGSGGRESCRGRVVIQTSAPSLFVAKGVGVVIDTVCGVLNGTNDDRQYVTRVALGIGLGTTCPVGPGEAITGHRLFEWVWNGPLTGTGIPFGSPIPNQHPSDPEPFFGVPPGSFCESVGNFVRGFGGIATVRFATGNCDLPTKYDQAAKCDDPSQTITVDGETAPPQQYGIRYQGENYRMTAQLSDDTPVPVEWTSSVCPPPPVEFAIAEKCDEFFPIGPDTVVYAVDPAIGPIEGAVRLIEQYPNPSCPERSCTAIIQYRPTATPTSGPATPGTAHLAGTACSLPTQVTCQACPVDPNPDDPITGPRSTGDNMLDAMGFDPEDELRRIRSGGCCGQPGG